MQTSVYYQGPKSTVGSTKFGTVNITWIRRVQKWSPMQMTAVVSGSLVIGAKFETGENCIRPHHKAAVSSDMQESGQFWLRSTLGTATSGRNLGYSSCS